MIESGWRHTDSKNEDGWETRYGSLTLIDAVRQGVADPSTILDRIMPESLWWGGATTRTRTRRQKLPVAFLSEEKPNVRLLENFSLEGF